jgi:OCT family organic cation transporter-like MFS transporter 4/5
VPTIRLRSLILFFIWFSVSLCYYGVTYYIPNLYGDKYLNFILSGGIELAAYLLAFVVLGRVGNKNPPKKTQKIPPKKTH